MNFQEKLSELKISSVKNQQFYNKNFDSLFAYLNSKIGKIIYPENFARKYNIDYLEAQKILLELVKEKITIPFYRLEILGKSEHEDFDTLSEIPDTYELNDEVIEAPLEHIYLLFKVSKK